MVKIKLDQFETIGEEYSKILQKTLGLKYIDDFFKYSFDELLEKTKIDRTRLTQISDILELFKIPGVSIRDAELLEAVNINSVAELSYRESARIHSKLKNLDEDTYYIILQLPTFQQIEDWIYYAKLMTWDIKSGLVIPLITLPMITIEIASEFKKYQIITIENLLSRAPFIPKLYRRVGMDKKTYNDMFDMISLLKIDGIDVNMAKTLFNAGIKNAQQFKQTVSEDILNSVKNSIQEFEIREEIMIKFNITRINEIKSKIEANVEMKVESKTETNLTEVQ